MEKKREEKKLEKLYRYLQKSLGLQSKAENKANEALAKATKTVHFLLASLNVIKCPFQLTVEDTLWTENVPRW